MNKADIGICAKKYICDVLMDALKRCHNAPSLLAQWQTCKQLGSAAPEEAWIMGETFTLTWLTVSADPRRYRGLHTCAFRSC